MTVDANEEYVKSKWQHIGEYNYGGTTQYVFIAVPGIEFYAESKEAVWGKVAEFTRQHEEKIRLVEEEIAYLEADRRPPQPAGPYLAAQRIMDREQAEFKKLKKGMK